MASETSSGIDWSGLLGTVVKEGSAVLQASIDKPLTNAATQQATNQVNSPNDSAQALAAAKSSTGIPSNLTPYIIGGGILIVGLFFFVALKGARK